MQNCNQNANYRCTCNDQDPVQTAVTGGHYGYNSSTGTRKMRMSTFEQNRRRDEEARAKLCEFYNTDYFNTLGTKYSPAPMPLKGNRRQRAATIRQARHTREAKLRQKEDDGVHVVRIPTERYGQDFNLTPWESGVKASPWNRDSVYVGHQPDQCPLKPAFHSRMFFSDVHIYTDARLFKGNTEAVCGLMHCLLPWQRESLRFDHV